MATIRRAERGFLSGGLRRILATHRGGHEPAHANRIAGPSKGPPNRLRQSLDFRPDPGPANHRTEKLAARLPTADAANGSPPPDSINPGGENRGNLSDSRISLPGKSPRQTPPGGQADTWLPYCRGYAKLKSRRPVKTLPVMPPACPALLGPRTVIAQNPSLSWRSDHE